MSTVKADWRLAEILEINNDPFEDVILTVGLSVDLRGSDEEIARAFTELRERERRLYAEGLKCGLRDKGNSCSDCPVAQLQQTHPMSRLCRLGKDMESVWAVHDRRVEEKRRPVLELVRVAEEYSELGHLDDELHEWLLGAGV